HRVDAGMPAKAVILGRQRSGNDVRRQRRGVYRIAAESVTAARFVQQLAVTVEHQRRPHGGLLEQIVGQRPVSQRPCNREDEEARTRDVAPARRHCSFLTSTRVASPRPLTSGSYICSAHAGAARNVPAVVARTRYANSCVPSPSRVANNCTRSSYFST